MSGQSERYKIVREQILDEIKRGVYAPGDAIPKQIELAERFQVSRGTVRKALEELVRGGVLIATKRKGTVVADTGVLKDTQRPLNFSSSLRVHGSNLKSKVLEMEIRKAEPWIAKQLVISIGDDVLYLKRVRILNGVPENYQISYVNLQHMKEVDFEQMDLENGSLYAGIQEQTGYYPAKKQEELRAIQCPENIAEELMLNKKDPVMLIMRTMYDQDGDVIEYCEDYENTNTKGVVFVTEVE